MSDGTYQNMLRLFSFLVMLQNIRNMSVIIHYAKTQKEMIIFVYKWIFFNDIFITTGEPSSAEGCKNGRVFIKIGISKSVD